MGCFGKRAKQNVLNPFYRQFSDASYGLNIRMHTLAIAVSYNKFLNMGQLVSQRQTRYELLSKGLASHTGLGVPRQRDNCSRGSWHGYYSLYDERKYCVSAELLIKALSAEGLQVTHGCHYTLLHHLKIFQTRRDGLYRQNNNPNPKSLYNSTSCPNADLYNFQTISFPLFLNEPLEIIERYIEACKKVFDNIIELQKIEEKTFEY